MGNRPSILHSIFLCWGVPKIDLFTTTKKKECFQFCARASLGHHSLRDAFLLQWNTSLFYDFLPVPLISKVLFKIRRKSTYSSHLGKTNICPPISLQLVPHLLFQDAGQIYPIYRFSDPRHGSSMVLNLGNGLL